MLYNPLKTKALAAAYFLMIAGAIAVTYISSPVKISSLDYKIGQALGAVSLTLLAIQMVMASRAKLLERGVGLDRITRWHSLNGRLIVFTVFLHPLLIFRRDLFGGIGPVAIIKGFTIYHWLGEIAFLLIILTVAVTIFSNVLRLKYEHWRVIHKVGYVIVLLGFAHSLKLGSDIVSHRPLYFWWLFLASLAAASVAYRWFLRSPQWYRVALVAKETKNVWTIFLRPERGEKLTHLPGQFAFVRFYSRGLSREEHHFTLSSSPKDNELSFTIKESGDFTSELGKLRQKDRALIDGPYGVFSNVGLTGPFVFIAGGIGITPLMSMLRAMINGNQGDKVTLIYANKTLAEAVFLPQIKAAASQTKNIKLVNVFSDQDAPRAYRGFVSAEIIKKEVGDIKNAKVFLCGPPAMMKAVQKILFDLGVNKANIFSEKFALR